MQVEVSDYGSSVLFIQPCLHTVFVAVPVVPQVVTYVNETDNVVIPCSRVATISTGVITLTFGRTWLGPNGNTVSTTATLSLPSINRTATGNYTCVTRLESNTNGLTTVNASTLVVVYLDLPQWQCHILSITLHHPHHRHLLLPHHLLTCRGRGHWTLHM